MLRHLVVASFILLVPGLASAQTAKFRIEEATIEDIQSSILRGEFFNILNHPNFAMNDLTRQVFAGSIDGERPLATAGPINWTGSARSRQIQFALKLLF